MGELGSASKPSNEKMAKKEHEQRILKTLQGYFHKGQRISAVKQIKKRTHAKHVPRDHRGTIIAVDRMVVLIKWDALEGLDLSEFPDHKPNAWKGAVVIKYKSTYADTLEELCETLN